MTFQQLSINIDADNAERLADIFFELGALAVSIEDQHSGTSNEQPIFDEPGVAEEAKLWQHSKVVVLLSGDSNVTVIIKAAEEDFGAQLAYNLALIDDQDWVRLTQSQFNPIQITDNFYIVPSWHKLPNPQAIGVVLDPGLAFGTGSHPTTFMCLHYLANHVTSEETVLDYGCGSGILAISAKKLGAKLVTGVDIDPQAIEASLANSQINQTAINFYLADQFEAATYDLVVANILANPLRLLASALASYVKTGGKIILSGILLSQIDELSDLYRPWFKVSVYLVQDGWACLSGIKV